MMLYWVLLISLYFPCVVPFTSHKLHTSRITSGFQPQRNNKLAFRAPNGYTNGQKFRTNHQRVRRQSKLYCSGTDDGEEEISDEDKLAKILKGTCIYLVGMMGSGKTSVGTELGKKLKYRFIDTDEIAEFMVEMPISDYFAQGNEEQFRQLETQILNEMGQYIRVVVSTGGGIVLKPENWGVLRHGIVVFLDVMPEQIIERFQKADEISKRPLLSEEADPLAKLEKIREDRIDIYRNADITITIPAISDPSSPTATPEDVANKVIQSTLQFIADNPPMWKQWKQKRDNNAVEMAARTNANALSQLGNELANKPEEPQQKGSINYVSLSDIQSGKVQLNGDNSSPPPIQGLPKETP